MLERWQSVRLGPGDIRTYIETCLRSKIPDPARHSRSTWLRRSYRFHRVGNTEQSEYAARLVEACGLWT